MKKTRKRIKKALFIVFLVLSLVGNVLLSYFLYENLRPVPSIMRFGFGEHNIVIYCEREPGITGMIATPEEGIYRIGDAELHSKEDLYLISPYGIKISLQSAVKPL